MKKLIIPIILLIFAFGLAQDFQPIETKQPVGFKRTECHLITHYDPGRDSNGQIIPDSTVITYDYIWIAIMVDEDGKETIAKGHLWKHLNATYKVGITQFMEYTGVGFQKLIPEQR